MILRRLTKHVNDQNWFAVALDIVIVVIGVGVALLGQQVLSDRAQRAEMERVFPAVRQDLGYNYGAVKERLSLVQCRVERYQEIATKLLAPSEEWIGMPFVVRDASRSEELARKTALPLVLRTPSRPMGSRVWEAEMARGTFNQLENERRGRIDRAFRQGGEFESLGDEINRLMGDMSLLAVSANINQSDRQHYYNVLGKLDGMSTEAEIIARQMVENIETIGFDGPTQDAKDILDYVAKENQGSLAIYGACYQPQMWPFFEVAATKAGPP